jgi:hypothetical protein
MGHPTIFTARSTIAFWRSISAAIARAVDAAGSAIKNLLCHLSRRMEPLGVKVNWWRLGTLFMLAPCSWHFRQHPLDVCQNNGHFSKLQINLLAQPLDGKSMVDCQLHALSGVWSIIRPWAASVGIVLGLLYCHQTKVLL